MRGGPRPGAGRPQKTKEEKAKNCTIKLYDWEIPLVKEFVKNLRKKSAENSY